MYKDIKARLNKALRYVNQRANASLVIAALYFFLVVVSGSLAILVYGCSVGRILSVCGMCALIALMVACVLKLLACKRYLYWSAFAMLASVLIVLSVTDLFMVSTFGKPFDQDIVDIIAETNDQETGEFFATYLTFGKILLWGLVIAAYVGLYHLLDWMVKKWPVAFRYVKYGFFALAIWGCAHRHLDV